MFLNMSRQLRRFCFVDVETTSLSAADPGTLLLEVAVLLTDSDLVELARESAVLSWSEAELAGARWDPVAHDMHVANGLLEEVLGSSAIPLREVEERLLHALGVDLDLLPDRPGFGSEHPDAPVFGGCSLTMDRIIVQRLLPRFYSRLSYRSLDATSLKLALEAWSPFPPPPREKKPHRAMADAIAARDLAAHARDVLRWSRTLETQRASA